MKYLRVHIEAKQPLMLNTRINGKSNALQSQETISGRTLRGAFAWALLEKYGEADPIFQQLIVEGGLHVGTAYPTLDSAQDDWSRLEVGPIPATATACKRFGGFQEHGVRDQLFEALRGAEKRRPDKVCGFKESHDSSACTMAMKTYRGYFQSGPGRDSARVETRDRQTTRCGIENLIGSVSQGMLYSLSTLSEGTRFIAELRFPDAVPDHVFTGLRTLRVGGSQTRGFGKLRLSWHRTEGVDSKDIDQRIEIFSEQARKRGFALEKDMFLVSLDCQTPCLISNAFFQDTAHPTNRDLSPYHNLDWRHVKSWDTSILVGGWDSLRGAARTTRKALAPGSVLLYVVRGPRDEVVDALTQLEQYGLGEGWDEGFGEVVVCRPFHDQNGTELGVEHDQS